jgi:hypothetical protein
MRKVELPLVSGLDAESVDSGASVALVEQKRLPLFVKSLTPTERTWLQEAVESPDTPFAGERINLLDGLTELNMATDIMSRREHLWIDQPPPERDPEPGMGRRVAWQTETALSQHPAPRLAQAALTRTPPSTELNYKNAQLSSEEDRA